MCPVGDDVADLRPNMRQRPGQSGWLCFFAVLLILAASGARCADERAPYSAKGGVVSLCCARDGHAVVVLSGLRWTEAPANAPQRLTVVVYGERRALQKTLRPGTKVRVALARSGAGKWHAAAYKVMAKNVNSSPSPSPPAGGKGGAAVFSLSVEPNPASPGGRVSLTMTLRNTSDAAITYDRPSSQRFEIAAGRDGKTVWKWSSGRFFTAAIESFSVPAGETLTYHAEWDLTDDGGRGVAPGTYELKAWLKTMGSQSPEAKPVVLVVR